MFVSGFVAGLAGAQLILGTEHRYPGVFQKGHGFDGIAIALLGANHPVGICAMALFFGVVRAGATKMQLIGIHQSFANIIQGFAVLFVAAHYIWRRVLSRGR
jgi:simple sugar transport system permease protein